MEIVSVLLRIKYDPLPIYLSIIELQMSLHN